MSLTARLMNIFAAPGEVFDEVRTAAPSVANWLAPALILILVSWVGVAVVFSQPAIKQQLNEVVDKAIHQAIEKQHLPKDKEEHAIEMAEKVGSISTMISSYAGPVVAALVTPFWWGLIVWLGGAKVFKGNFDYMKAVEVAGLGNMIGVLDAIVRTLLILVMGNLFVSPSLMLLLKDFNPQNPMHSLLALANVMTLWVLAVRAIGLARLANISFAKAALWVFGIWAAYTGLFWGLGAAAQMVAKRASGS
jgi:hypothetical protein